MRKLLDWFLSWFRKPIEERLDFYRPAERFVYGWWDGSKEVRADPMVLYKKLMDVGPDVSIAIKVSESPSKDADKARQDLLGYIRRIFGLSSFEDGGLTEIETLQLLDHFLVYTETLKKNTRNSPTSPTATSPPSASSAGGSPATPSTSGSGSTASELPTGDQGPSLPPSELPSGSPTPAGTTGTP